MGLHTGMYELLSVRHRANCQFFKRQSQIGENATWLPQSSFLALARKYKCNLGKRKKRFRAIYQEFGTSVMKLDIQIHPILSKCF